MIVVDASAMLEVLLRTPSAARIEARLLDSGEALHAPELLDLEVAQVLRRNALAGRLTESRGREALEILRTLRVHRHAHGPLLARVWALRENATAYDAAYVALAEALPATLVTCDQALASIRGHRATVEIA